MHNFRTSRHLLLVLCVAVYCKVTLGSGKDCVGQDQCSCVMSDDQSVIDITSIGNSDETPRFKDVKSQDGGLYSYNPCFPFSEGDCEDAAVCMTSSGESGSIGSAESAKFIYDSGHVVVGYTAGSGILTLAQVTLKCEESACEPTLVAEGSQGLGQYKLTMTTVCACPNGCDANGPKNCKGKKGGGASGSLSGGSVILIIFFVLVIMYMVGGVLFMKFKVKAEGKDVIPNVGFWGSLPSLIKDGVLFTLRPCIRRK